uniref:Uncharacterized protein n=1 Tax=Meloidogyne incognita TaxID=6306 RepID=A0A914KQ51_MELIC
MFSQINKHQLALFQLYNGHVHNCLLHLLCHWLQINENCSRNMCFREESII